MTRSYGDYSFWLATCDDDLTPRPPLGGSSDFDVAIVGGGYTGLWTAYYLRTHDPSLRVAVIEREICGFGASGRNGGWCSALFAAPKKKIAKQHGRDAARAMQDAMIATVDEVGRVCEVENIDAHFHKGGTLSLATGRAQLDRVKEEVEEERRWGYPQVEWLSADEARQRIRAEGLLGAGYTPDCAVVQPARLARGLARAVEARGAQIFEQTAATEIGEGVVHTDAGDVKAPMIVRATEGYTPTLAGERRTLLPIYSLMIATEPLPDEMWEVIGWNGRETVTDGRHLIIYAQRTKDGRIAFGGRGAPYHYGSRIEDRFDREPDVFSELERVVNELWPVTRDAKITHRWGGPLGVPRDWFSSVGLDRQRGFAWGGGYVGDGVSTTNLAGQTIADLILERPTDITRLPWVGHEWRRWEPEPLRWTGVNLSLKTMELADAAEARTGKASRRGTLLRRLIGAG